MPRASDALEMGVRAGARNRPDARRSARARGHGLGEPAVRHAVRDRAPHGRAVSRRARDRSVGRRTRPGAHHAPAARPAGGRRLLPPAREPAVDGGGAVDDDSRAPNGRRARGGPEAGRLRVSRQARRARRAPDRVRIVPGNERARRPRDRVPGSSSTPRLEPDPAARLLDDAAGRRLVAARAQAVRRAPRRAHRAADDCVARPRAAATAQASSQPIASRPTAENPLGFLTQPEGFSAMATEAVA